MLTALTKGKDELLVVEQLNLFPNKFTKGALVNQLRGRITFVTSYKRKNGSRGVG
jgi:hypothetical protein